MSTTTRLVHHEGIFTAYEQPKDRTYLVTTILLRSFRFTKMKMCNREISFKPECCNKHKENMNTLNSVSIKQFDSTKDNAKFNLQVQFKQD